MEDLYQILSVDKTATLDEIKKSYRKLSLQNHPDRNNSPEAGQIFAKISEAYEILSDDRKRRQYDMQQSGGIPGMSGMFQGGVEIHNMDDIFNSIFGGMAGFPGMGGMGGQPEVHVFSSNNMGGIPQMFRNLQKPPPITKTLHLTMEQAYYGGSFSLEIERWFILNNSKVSEKETLTFTVPQGVDNSEVLVLREKGNVINPNQKGDVKIFIDIDEHSEFERHGLDLLYKKTVTLKEALCGFCFEIHHLNKRDISFNNASSNMIVKPGFRKIIKDLGFRKENNIGNLIIEFSVQFPDSLSEEQSKKISEIL